MLQSKLFTKTSKQAPKDEVSVNAQLLMRAGYVDKLMSGVYTYLPLGLRVLDNIKNIIREEMNNFGGQEILMPALTPKENWLKTGRWDGMDVLFKLEGADKKEYALGATHEEVVTPLVKKYVTTYKDLPMAVYQIQDKFRNEPRAKSGLMRGREFSMKDLYSFHRDEADLDRYYEESKEVYLRIYKKCGLDALLVEASGGTFSKFSHEFQVLTEFGEDEVYVCKCGRHQNKELVSDGNLTCPHCSATREVKKAIEVGNIFKLKTKYSAAFDYTYIDEKGTQQPVQMGCYGIGPSRMMGALVELNHDEKGIIWPENVAPFKIHLVALGKEENTYGEANKIYQDLMKKGVEVLFDDRREASAGAKFADSDLLGIPTRLVVSAKTLEQGSVELKKRNESNSRLIKISEAVKMF